jgi:hypothetical protein
MSALDMPISMDVVGSHARAAIHQTPDITEVGTKIWTAWNNGEHSLSGAGYGFKIDAADRDRYFEHEWKTAGIELPTNGGVRSVVINLVKPSFWNEPCRQVSGCTNVFR